MADKEHLNIDYKKHVEYLASTKRVLTERLVFAPMNKRVDSGKWHNAWRVKINPDKSAAITLWGISPGQRSCRP